MVNVKTFRAHLRNGKNGTRIDVTLEVSTQGLRLKDQNQAFLGHFAFERILQWAIHEPGCFTFAVLIDQKDTPKRVTRDVFLYSTPKEAVAIVQTVEASVKELMKQREEAQRRGVAPNQEANKAKDKGSKGWFQSSKKDKQPEPSAPPPPSRAPGPPPPPAQGHPPPPAPHLLPGPNPSGFNVDVSSFGEDFSPLAQSPAPPPAAQPQQAPPAPHPHHPSPAAHAHHPPASSPPHQAPPPPPAPSHPAAPPAPQPGTTQPQTYQRPPSPSPAPQPPSPTFNDHHPPAYQEPPPPVHHSPPQAHAPPMHSRAPAPFTYGQAPPPSHQAANDQHSSPPLPPSPPEAAGPDAGYHAQQGQPPPGSPPHQVDLQPPQAPLQTPHSPPQVPHPPPQSAPQLQPEVAPFAPASVPIPHLQPAGGAAVAVAPASEPVATAYTPGMTPLLTPNPWLPAHIAATAPYGHQPYMYPNPYGGMPGMAGYHGGLPKMLHGSPLMGSPAGGGEVGKVGPLLGGDHSLATSPVKLAEAHASGAAAVADALSQTRGIAARMRDELSRRDEAVAAAERREAQTRHAAEGYVAEMEQSLQDAQVALEKRDREAQQVALEMEAVAQSTAHSISSLAPYTALGVGPYHRMVPPGMEALGELEAMRKEQQDLREEVQRLRRAAEGGGGRAEPRSAPLAPDSAPYVDAPWNMTEDDMRGMLHDANLQQLAEATQAKNRHLEARLAEAQASLRLAQEEKEQGAAAGSDAQRELQERMRRALEEREEENGSLKARLVQAERQATSLRADLVGRVAELRSKERQLQAYEDSLGQSFDGLLGGLAPGDKEDVPDGRTRVSLHGELVEGGPLAQLRALMGEAYLLKMTLKKQEGAAASKASQEVNAALDAWIMASHSLKKACQAANTTNGTETQAW